MRWRRFDVRHQSPAQQAPQPWGRGKLLAALGGLLIGFLGIVIGLGFVVHTAITGAPGQATEQGLDTAADVQTRLDQQAHRDAVAASPMLQVDPEASLSGTPAARLGDTMTIPESTLIGPGKVPAGFPRTPEGAVGQLASIEVAVMSEMSVARTSEIHQAWAMPGAVDVADWVLMGNVRSFLGAARMGPVKDVGAYVTVTPVAAQVKATDGPDWVVACVLTDVRAVIRAESRMAYGYCEAMLWNEDRWMIAPGMAAATAPSTWPGTEIAIKAGWRAWVRDGQ